MNLAALPLDQERIRAFCKKNYRILFLGLLGLVLLIWPTAKQSEAEPVIAETAEEVFSLDAFEQKLEKLLSEIEGVGTVRVMLTLDCGTELVYAADEHTVLRVDSDGSSQETDRTLVTDSGGALEKKQIYPRFSGAVVVCDGAERASVKWMVLSAVSAVTGLSTDRIGVLPRK